MTTNLEARVYQFALEVQKLKRELEAPVTTFPGPSLDDFELIEADEDGNEVWELDDEPQTTRKFRDGK